MRKILVLAAVPLFCATLTAAAAPLSLVQNEYAFAQAVAKHGVRDGFLVYLDQQSITLSPQPAKAYDVYSQRKASSTKLSWYPDYALLSSSGDFGVETGPWVASWQEGGKPQQSYGDWLTVWHRGKDSRWLILFDGGVDHAAPLKRVKALLKDSKVISLPKPAAQEPDVDKLHFSLVEAEAEFSNTELESSPKAAYQGQGSPDIHLLEEGAQARVGLPEVLAAMSNQQGKWRWVPSGGSIASSGDLAYMYGVIYAAKDDDNKRPLGSYAHVWRMEKGEWKLQLDLELPVPPQDKKPG